MKKNAHLHTYAICTSFVLVLVCTLCACGGGGGGGGTGGAGYEGGVTVSKSQSSTNAKESLYYGIEPSQLIEPQVTTTEVEMPPMTVDQGQSSNGYAVGAGVYSEALEGKVESVEFTLTIDGVTETFKITGEQSIVLKNVTPGTLITLESGTVTLKDGGGTKSLVKKTYTTEAFQGALPLFVLYTAKLMNNGNVIGSFEYSTDKPIKLPVLSGNFVGWSVSAPGLSINGNYYAGGAIVPTGQLCGDITFNADFVPQPLCQVSGTDFVITSDGIELSQGTDADICYSDDSTTMGYNDVLFTSVSVANTNLATVANKRVTAKMPGTTTMTIVAQSTCGKLVTMRFPLVITAVEYTEANYGTTKKFTASTQEQFEQILSLLATKDFENRTITLEGDFTLPDGFTSLDCNGGFKGTLDGNGKTLSGTVEGGGLFKTLGDDFVVQNVTLSLKVKPTSDGSCGILAGNANVQDTDNTYITNVTVSNSSITVDNFMGTHLEVGGLVGKVETYSPIITGCSVENMQYNITANSINSLYLGGLVGNMLSSARLSSCKAPNGTATITATNLSSATTDNFKVGAHYGNFGGWGSTGDASNSSITYTLNGAAPVAVNTALP